MANPQVENGHLKIANELVEALARTRISGEDNQVLWAVIRKTYGWQLKEDLISLDWIVKLTGLMKPNACRSLTRLVSRNIVTKSGNGRETKYGLQKDYEKWEISLSNLITTSQKVIIKTDNDKPIIKTDNHPLSKLITQLPKDTFKDTPPVLKAILPPQKVIIKTDNEKTKKSLLSGVFPPLDKFSELKNQFQTTWNLLAREKALAKVISIPKTRENKLRTRFQEEAFRQNVEKIFSEIKDSAFLLGANDRNWKIDFDWLIENDRNYLKVLEGKYKNKEAQYGRTGAKRNILDAGSQAAFDRIDAKAREEMEAGLREEAGGTEGKPSEDGLFPMPKL